jgi:glycosyltransferase involved in cell wall biosynthesis
MRILIANHTPVYGSGAGTYILTLAEGLAARGHDIALLTPPGGPPVPVAPGIRRFTARDLAGEFPSFTGHPCSPRLYSQLSSAGLAAVVRAWQRSLGTVISSWGPTIVHAQHLWVLTSAALNLGQAVVATCHGSEVPYLDRERVRVRRFEGESPAAVVSVSRYIQRLADRHLKTGTPHVALLNPYDQSRFSYRRQPVAGRGLRVGFVGRLVKYKRADLFLEIVRGLVGLVPELEAWIIGDGPERPALEGLAVSLGLVGRTRFTGFQAPSSMPDFYRDLDALITCSPSEPFGLAAIEAAACGTPVFVPAEGGLAELEASPYIHGYYGDLPRSISSEIAKTLAERDTESQREQRSLYVAERYSLDSYLGRLEQIYSRTAEGSPE